MPDNTSSDLSEYLKQLRSVRESYETSLKQKIGGRTFDFLENHIQGLLVDSEAVKSILNSSNLPYDLNIIDDYSFVVFPAAKAYEGFLKQLSVKAKFTTVKKRKNVLITRRLLEVEPDFGIGKIFNEQDNPKIKSALKDKSRYKSYPDLMRTAWDLCRCDILHYDFSNPVKRRRNQIEDELSMIYRAIKCGYEGYINTPDYSAEEIMSQIRARFENIGTNNN